MSLPFKEDSPLELSTQLILSRAEERGLETEILDETDNLIRLSGQGHTEYIHQATRTSADPYIVHYLMANKWASRILLERNGLPIAPGESYTSKETALDAWTRWQGQALVIKPNNTNFGKGITMLTELHSFEEYKNACDEAFGFGDRILAERWIRGTEYRFLVIGGQTRAVLQRLPAHVTGDGTLTVAELVQQKNKHPFRGTGYRKPLEKIKIGPVESARLAEMGLTLDTVIPAGQDVFLRTNSNISTGGDSIDRTDEAHPLLKEMAAAAAEALGAAITGLDIITEDITASPETMPATIIELNFNPALHIHCYPAQGSPRPVADDVLDLLGFRRNENAAD